MPQPPDKRTGPVTATGPADSPTPSEAAPNLRAGTVSPPPPGVLDLGNGEVMCIGGTAADFLAAADWLARNYPDGPSGERLGPLRGPILNMAGIVIHRSHHAQQYVVVPNAIARDRTLSFRARGLLVMLLSLPPEWHVTTDMLAEDNPDSRTAIRAAMAELRQAGYVELVTERGKDGRTRRHHEVFDTKRGQVAFGPTSGNDASSQVAPTAGKPAVGIPAVKKKYKTSSARKQARDGEVKTRPPWCGECDETTRLTGDPPRRCPDCHPLAVVTS